MSVFRRLQTVGWLGFIVVCLLIFSWVTFLSPQLQTPLRSLFSPAERKILSVATGPIFPEGKRGRVLKLSTTEGIVLEIYGPLKEQAEALIDRIVLGDRRDGYFQFQARATNLALKDLDNDLVYEIIAPSYDASLIPRLNIFRYNKDSAKFEPFEPATPGL
jgi:hypothetical protein